MKVIKYVILTLCLAIALFLCFLNSKEQRLRRQMDTYNRRVKEYLEKDSISRVPNVINQEKPKFIRKQIDYKDISMKWFYYSHITNNSPDFVVVEKNGNKKEIFKATWTVLDVTLKDHNIILKTLGPSKSMVFTKYIEEEVFGYKITLDTTGTYRETRLIPDGVKEGRSDIRRSLFAGDQSDSTFHRL